MLNAENWCVKVDEKVYGPYSSAQMRKYAHEGRLASWSLIAPAGNKAWREARKESAFANFFGFDVSNRPKEAPSGRTFGKSNQSSAGYDSDAQNNEAANFIIVFDDVDGAAGRLETAIRGLGNALRMASNVWTVNTALTAVGVRNALAPYLHTNESIFVVDATRGRTSWQNFAPELHAKISAAFTPPKPKSRPLQRAV